MIGQPTTTAVEDPRARPQDNCAPDAAELVLEDRFSMAPEWFLDADIGDCALRLYAVLLRYGNTTGALMPSRTTLARRLHKKSTDTVDRAVAELVRLGAVRVEHRCFEQRRRAQWNLAVDVTADWLVSLRPREVTPPPLGCACTQRFVPCARWG